MENKEKNTTEIKTKAELFEDTFLKAAALFMAVIVAFSVIKIGADSGKKMKPYVIYSNSGSTSTVNNNEKPNNSTTSNEAPDSSNASNEANATEGTQPAETEKPANTNEEKTTAEIVALYNESVNKVKPEAKKITRNYEHQKSDENYFEMPSAISGLAKTAMNMFIKGNDEPQVWTTKEDFKLGFPVSGEDYSSHLKPEMVKSATCKDNGSTYEIDIVLLDDSITNPKKGEGYAGVFTTVTADTITSANVPGVTYEKVNVNGIGGRIACTVDKASKHITDIVFINTDVLDMSVKVFVGTLDAKFALACERSYTVEY